MFRRKPAATFWHQATPGTTYVRCELPARYLPGQALELAYSDLKEDKGGNPFMPRAEGAQVWQFPGDWVRGTLMAHQRDNGQRVLVEVDDNYLTLPPQQQGLNVEWNRKIADNPHGYSAEAHERICRWADGIIVSTPTLEKKYLKVNPNVYLCPNAVDPKDWKSVLSKPDDGVFRIVYAGSPSHQRDSTLVASALEWASRQKDVEVYCFGFVPHAWKFPVEVLSWTDDLQLYRDQLGIFDLGVAPLIENPWSICKSDLKVLEYAIAGVLPVVSNTRPYEPWLDSPVRFAESKSDFVNWVKWAVQNRDDVSLFASELRKQVIETRTIQATVHRWREAIQGDQA